MPKIRESHNCGVCALGLFESDKQTGWCIIKNAEKTRQNSCRSYFKEKINFKK